MATRRSQRRGKEALPSKTAAAFESMRRLRTGGKSRMQDYEVQEEAPVYDEVDEENYKRIAEQKRKEAKEFLAAGDSDEEEASDALEADLESEFEYEEMESFLVDENAQGSAKKRRKSAPGTRTRRRKDKASAEPNDPKARLPAAYFKLGGGTTSNVEKEHPLQEAEEIESVLDTLFDDGTSAQGSVTTATGNRRRVQGALRFSELQRRGVSTGKLREVLGPVFDEEEPRPIQKTENDYSEPPPAMGGDLIQEDQVTTTNQVEVDGADGDHTNNSRRTNPLKREREVTSLQQSTPVRPKLSEVQRAEPTGETNGQIPVPIAKLEAKLELELSDMITDSLLPKEEKRTEPPEDDFAAEWASIANRTLEPSKVQEDIAFEQDGSMLVYWLDLFEVRVQGGERLYLLGRVPVGDPGESNYASICVQINGLQRELYFLPRDELLDEDGKPTGREPDMWEDVHPEVEQMLFREAKVPEILAKEAKMSFPFDDSKELRATNSYLMVRYSMENSSISQTTQGRSFSRVFGAKTSATERFVLGKRMMGPCWLRIQKPRPMDTKQSWTRFGYVVDDPDSITVCEDQRAIPTLSVLSINLITASCPKSHEEEVVIASGIYLPEYPLTAPPTKEQLRKGSTFSVICPPSNKTLPRIPFNVECVPTESTLLNFLLAKFQRLEPDILVGHDLMGGILEKLLYRMKFRDTAKWSRIGRLNQSKPLAELLKSTGRSQFGLRNVVADAIAGRLPCDTYTQAKELLPKEKDYSLSALCQSQLKAELGSINLKDVSDMLTHIDGVTDLVTLSEKRAQTALQLTVHLSIIPLTKQLTNISGNVWSKTLRGARAERIEYLLSHEFLQTRANHEDGVGYILPDKGAWKSGSSGKSSTATKKKSQYAGGLVLEPKRGLYDDFVLQLDFNSLYPSIIQEYNICFTTVIPTEGGAEIPNESVSEGVMPRVLRRLVNQRKAVKAEMKTTKNELAYKQLETRQLAIKLTANSVYGCLGFEYSRFYARPMAEVVTAHGRDTLQKTVELAQSQRMDVIYGDTDSLFINTGLKDLSAVVTRGGELKKEVNRRYKTLEIEVDGVYIKMLLLRKKKYAAVRIADLRKPSNLIREVKGLDMVRHDWCDLSHDASEFSLTQILDKGTTADEAIANVLNYLSVLAEKVRGNRFSMKKYIITKSLQKMPEEYPDAKVTPHVKVAMRGKLFGKTFKVGDYVQYVVCKQVDGHSDTIAERAFHPEEIIASQGKLVVDFEWYLNNQVLPPIARLTDPIDGVEAAHLAGALGLDTKQYYRANPSGKTEDPEEGEFGDLQTSNPADRYSDCQEWRVRCRYCDEEKAFTGIAVEHGKVVDWGILCNCGELYSEVTLRLQLQMQIREWISTYYLTPLEEKTDDGTVIHHRNPRLLSNINVTRKWSSRWLYQQFRYLLWVLDPHRGMELAKSEPPLETEDQPEKIEMKPQPATVVINAKKESPVVRALYERLHKQAGEAFNYNGYRFVDLSKLLSAFNIKESSPDEVMLAERDEEDLEDDIAKDVNVKLSPDLEEAPADDFVVTTPNRPGVGTPDE